MWCNYVVGKFLEFLQFETLPASVFKLNRLEACRIAMGLSDRGSYFQFQLLNFLGSPCCCLPWKGTIYKSGLLSICCQCS